MNLAHNAISLLGRLLGRNKLSILIYHSVFEQRDELRESEPDASEFRWQMNLLKKYFAPLSLTEALTHLQQGTLPANAVCITFDDGYANNLKVAAPILKELGIPATVYVSTGFSLGKNMWNDMLIDLVEAAPEMLLCEALDRPGLEVKTLAQKRQARELLIEQIKYRPIAERLKLIKALHEENGISFTAGQMMPPEQIVELDAMGIEIGAHTADHPILKTLTAEEQLKQIQESKTMLESWLNKPVTGFAYPNGKLEIDYDAGTRDIVKQLGFNYAVTTNNGFSTRNTDVFQLKRFTPWDKHPLKFHLRLILNTLSKEN